MDIGPSVLPQVHGHMGSKISPNPYNMSSKELVEYAEMNSGHLIIEDIDEELTDAAKRKKIHVSDLPPIN